MNSGFRIFSCRLAMLLSTVICAPALAVDSVEEGNFVIPGWFSQQPKPYERPAEIFTSRPTSDTTSAAANFNNGSGLFGYSPYIGSPISYGLGRIPYVGGFSPLYGGGYGNWGVNRWTGGGIPGMGFGGYGLGAIGGLGGFVPGLGGFGPGLGWGGLSGWGRPLGWGGIGPGLGFGGFGPGFGMGNAAMFMGPFGNGGSFQGTTPNRVIQTAPSKASGNFYQPSTVDTTASGSYYASDTPAMLPVMKQKSQPQSYWGSSSKDNWGPAGDPFPKDLNSVPWAK